MQRRYNIHDNDFEEQFRFELVDVVYEWAKGMVREPLSLFSNVFDDI